MSKTTQHVIQKNLKRAFNTLSIITISMLSFSTAQAKFLPPNTLHLREAVGPSNLTEEQFNRITDSILRVWQPFAKAHGAQLVPVKDWNDPTVNAFAQQRGNIWEVHMFGGLARRPEMTPDGFAMVVCHELGHHFAGYAYYDNNDWASAEGEADYWAARVCARRLWGSKAQQAETARHLRPRNLDASNPANAVASICAANWPNPAEQALCSRIADASQSLANLLAAVKNAPVPNVTVRDAAQVSSTFTGHPEAQCRLDTLMSGSVCAQGFDLNIIPGRGNPSGQISIDAEKEAARFSCTEANHDRAGWRPRCWFKPLADGPSVGTQQSAPAGFRPMPRIVSRYHR